MERDSEETDYYDIFIISTHTLTWSVTQCSYICKILLGHFNSHAHVERDTLFSWSHLPFEISTHTLTWSVT